MEGQHGHICRFPVGPVYPNKLPTMCSSDFVFRKYKQHKAFRVSGVLQLAKTAPLVGKNFPLLHLFPSDAMMAWRLYTPYDVNCTNLHSLTARGMSHILTRIGQLWSSRKNSYALVQSPNSKITVQLRYIRTTHTRVIRLYFAYTRMSIRVYTNQCSIDFNFLE